jgi:hypothetical protein
VFLKQLSYAEKAKLKYPPIESKAWLGFYYLDPDDLYSIEEPLLLHPYFDKPSKHIRFGVRGLEAPCVNDDGRPSLLGQHTIQVLNLDDQGLRDRRDEAQRAVWGVFTTAYQHAVNEKKSLDECKQSAWQSVKEFLNGKDGAFRCSARRDPIAPR